MFAPPLSGGPGLSRGARCIQELSCPPNPHFKKWVPLWRKQPREGSPGLGHISCGGFQRARDKVSQRSLT